MVFMMNCTSRWSLVSIRLSNRFIGDQFNWIVHLRSGKAELKKKQTKNNWKEGICKTFISFKFRFISISFYDFSIFQTIWYKNELMYLYLATMPLSIGLVFFLKESLWITCKQLKKCHERFTGIVCLFPRILRFLWCSQLTRVRL